MKFSKAIQKLFSEQPLFAGLNEQQQKDIAKILIEESFAQGDVIVKEGDMGNAVHMILDGSAEVISQQESITTLKPGDTIGEMSLFDQQPRSADVVALEKTNTIYFNVDDLEGLSDKNLSVESLVKLNFAMNLSKNLRMTNVKTIADRKKYQDEMRQAKNYDRDTGLANEHYLMKEAKSLIEAAGSKLHLYIIEIADFENEPALLATIVSRMHEFFDDAILISRLARNQFALLYANESIERISQHIRGEFALPFNVAGSEISLSVYVGIACSPDDANNEKELVSHAELALDAAKLEDVGAFAIYNKSMKERVAERRQLIKDMQTGLNTQQFLLYYQPQIRLRDGFLAGVEALVRWNHPTRGMVSPADFIPAAESSGLINKLGDWILKEACRQAKQWQTQNGHLIRVAINLSAKQFAQKNLIEEIANVIKQEKLDPKLIELEITESLMMDDVEGTIAKIQALADLGFYIAIDDFGTGYSSLSYLSKLPAHKLKIDQSFVRDINKSEESRDIIRCISSLAQSLKMETIAEGIEDAAEIDFLKSLGCEEGQGYFYDKPLPANEFEQIYLLGEDKYHEHG